MGLDGSAPQGPLAGLRVLELGNFIAAPFATKILADFGAEVIKVEQPRTGDELRQWRTPAGTTSMLFRAIARNKKSVTLDLRTERGRNLALDLAGKSHLVFENFRPGTLEKWGLGPADLYAVNPDSILVRISGYGQTGPYRDRGGFGSVAEAVGGLRFITGEPDRPAGRAAGSIGDTVAGLYGVIGALMLLARKGTFVPTNPHDRATADSVEVVDVALYEAVFGVLESLIADYDAFGIVRERTGGSLPGVVPTGSYPCNDGSEVIIGANSDGLFDRLIRVMGRDDLIDNPEYHGGVARARHEEELNAAVAEWTSRHSVAEVVRLLDEAGVPVAPVYDATGIANDAQYQAREMHQPFDVPVGGGQVKTVRFPGVVPKLPGSPGSVTSAGPEIGEHTNEILRDLLGLSLEQIDALKNDGVT